MSQTDIPRMDWLAANQAETFKLFKQRLDLFFKVKKIKNEEQVSYILLQVGDEGLRRYNAWSLDDSVRNDPDVIFKAFLDQLEPCEHFRVCRLKLMKYKQEINECLDDFVNRCKLLALKCDFSEAEINERITELIIASTPIVEYQKELLQKDKGFTLKEALQLGRTYEAAASNVKQIQNMNINKNNCSDANISAIRSSYNKECYNCGKQHSFESKSNCPAFGTVCKKCNKKNHWAIVCKPKKFNKDFSEKRGRSKSRNRNFSYGYQKKGRSPSRNRYKQINECHKTSNVNEYVPDQLDSNFDSMNFNARYISDMCFDSSSCDEAFVNLKITLPSFKGFHNLKLKVDTGAQANTLPIRLFRNMFPNFLNCNGFPVEKFSSLTKNMKFFAYNDTVIDCYGCVSIPCKFSDYEWVKTNFFIVNVKGPAVLGLNSSEKLNVVRLHNDVIRSHEISTLQCDGMREVKKKDKPVVENVTELVVRNENEYISEQISTPVMNSETQRINNVSDLKRLYPDQFDRIGNFPGEVKLYVNPGIQPRINAPRKPAIALKDTLKDELDKMEKQGVIKKVTEPTEWVSSLTFAEKEDGSHRICLDPRHLNKALRRPHHRMPTVEEITHHLRGAKIFSKMDAKSGYWSVKLDPESQLLTTFQTPFGRYCFRRLPFGLSVSQDIFQLKMDQIIDQVDGVIGIADDVAVYAKTEEEHDKIIHNLMQMAEKNGLVFNSNKCKIKEKKIKFFGTIYADDGIHPDPKKVSDLKSMPAPKCKKELQVFLGFITYMSPFIANLSSQSAILRELLKEEAVFLWEPHHQLCFDKLKCSVSDESTLQYFDTTVTPVLQVDASLLGLGATLLQKDKPVAFASKALSDAESRYVCIERELLAIVYGIQRFHTYLYGRYFKVITDHKPLVMIMEKPISSAPPRLQRLLLKVQGYKFDLEYRPGRELVLADALSRLPSAVNCETVKLDLHVDLLKFHSDRLANIRECTQQDPVLNKLMETIMVGWPEKQKDLPTSLRSYWSYRDELSVENGIIMKGERVLIPQEVKEIILKQLHVGHQGIEKTKLRAKESVFWCGINKDIENLVKECSICQEHQPSQTCETLMPHDIPCKPWDTVGTDLFHYNGSEYLIVVDYYSKFPIVKKLPTHYTSGVVISVLKQIFSEYGIPNKVMSDNGPQYASFSFKSFAEEWGFQHCTSSPRFPQSNGMVERHIRTVKSMFQKADQGHTDKELALLCLRTTPVSSKIPSPGEILMGRKLRCNLPVKTKNSSFADSDEIQNELQVRQDKQKMYFDRKSKDLPPLIPGQNVRVQNTDSGHWEKATVISDCNQPRSYILNTEDGKNLRRNRVQIRESSEPPATKHIRFANPCVSDIFPCPYNDKSDSNNENESHDFPNTNSNEPNCSNSEGYKTRCGRTVRKPSRLDM